MSKKEILKKKERGPSWSPVSITPAIINLTPCINLRFKHLLCHLWIHTLTVKWSGMKSTYLENLKLSRASEVNSFGNTGNTGNSGWISEAPEEYCLNNLLSWSPGLHIPIQTSVTARELHLQSMLQVTVIQQALVCLRTTDLVQPPTQYGGLLSKIPPHSTSRNQGAHSFISLLVPPFYGFNY